MQEVTSNMFATGLSTDLHPLTMPTTGMTDALNATCRTYNGNELLLQNDMGNTLIQDSTTGNIMGLNDGFVPVGMKEYGGILYIASYNPKTKISELGTIPSPVVNYTYRTDPYEINTDIYTTSSYAINDVISKTTPTDFTTSDWYKKTSYVICKDHRFQVGEQFIVGMNVSNPKVKRYNFKGDSCIRGNNKETYGVYNGYREIPMISYILDDYKISGYFDCLLETKTSNSADTVRLSDINNKALNYYTTDSNELKTSAYWFLTENSVSLNTDYCQADQCYLSYPNILPGYLYICFEPNVQIDSFENFNCYFYSIEENG